MKAETIAVGTEVLIGDVIDTNTPWIARALKEHGIPLYHRSVVGDNRERLRAVLEEARQRSDLIILSGGLGPTYDDITKAVVAEVCDLPLVEDPSTRAVYEAFFARRGETPTENNLGQALIPAGATTLANSAGLAPGIDLVHEGVRYVLLPGPPRELMATFTESLAPRLFDQETSYILSQGMHFYGIGEAELDAVLREEMEQATNPTIAPYVAGGEVTLRIRTRAADEATARALAAPVIEAIAKRFPAHYYGLDVCGLEEAVGRRLLARGATFASAESCTGGLIMKRITDIPGSSQYMLGGICSYANSAKIALLDVPEAVLRQDGAVSEASALAMVRGVAARFGADYAISTTGVAGPEASERKPVGYAWIGVHTPKRDYAFPYQASTIVTGERRLVRSAVAKRALYALWRELGDA